MRITMHVCIIDMKHIRKREREREMMTMKNIVDDQHKLQKH